MTSTATPARPRATKRFKALIAVGLSDAEAFDTLGWTAPDAAPAEVVAEPEVDPRIAALIEGGFTEAQATKIVADRDGGKKAGKGKKGKGKKADAKAAAPELTAKDRDDALVAKHGLAHARGRVYVTGAILEAAARVLKGREAEVVQTSGTGRTTHVLVSRTESGDVSIQNLYKP